MSLMHFLKFSEFSDAYMAFVDMKRTELTDIEMYKNERCP